MISSALKSSSSDEWSTPQDLFDKLNKEFSFTLDPCATEENAKCPKFFTKFNNGIGIDKRWNNEVVFMNPPYSQIERWMFEAWRRSVHDNALVVCLVPARTDTFWWHETAMKAEIRFIRGRLRFSGSKENAPFPSAIVIFRPNAE